MGQSSGIAGYTTFVGGLVTDTSAINSSDNVIKVGENFDITRRGTLEKRLGLAVEEEVLSESFGSLFDKDFPISNQKLTTYDGKRWEVFYQTLGSVKPVVLREEATQNLKYLTSNVDSISSSDRYILVTKGRIVSVWSYNDSDFVFKSDSAIKVRDFDGLEDNLDNETRPATLSAAHLYNLENQGWGRSVISNSSNSYNTDWKIFAPVSTEGVQSPFPSNADIPALGIFEDPDSDGRKEFKPDNIKNTYLGNARAPMGKNILDTSVASPRSIQSDSTYVLTSQPQYPFSYTKLCSTFFAGRVFYGGANNVFFSQTLGEDDRKAYKCYQEADPTSEEFSEVIATDGGQIKISGASNIFRLEEIGAMLVVFAENGIWAISGGETTFSATQYSVKKISTYTALNFNSVINFGGGLAFIAQNGVLSLSQNEVTLDGVVSSLTDGKIQELYDTYTAEELRTASLSFSVKENKLYLLIGRELLIYDLVLTAWYMHKVPVGALGLSYQDDTKLVSSLQTITHEGVDVEYEAETLVLSTTVATSVVSKMELLYEDEVENRINSCSFSDLSYFDFKDTEKEQEYEAFFITYPVHGGSLSTTKRIKQVACFFERTETGFEENEEGGLEYVNPSSCKFQVGWNFPTNTSYIADEYNKWSREYEVYRLSRLEISNLGDSPLQATETISTRTSVRGSGKTMSFKFSSPSGFDCRLLGWTIEGLSTTREK